MAQAPLELEREIDLVHVTCGYHCQFKGYTPDQTMAFYECIKCKIVFPIGYILPNAETEKEQEPQASASEAVEQTTDNEILTPPIPVQAQENAPEKPKPKSHKKST